MNDNTTLASVADTVLDKSVTFDVTILHPSRLQRIRKQTKKSFKISPATLGTMIKISKEFLSVDMENFNKEDVMQASFSIIINHAERMARIVAMAVLNTKKEPPQSMVEFFLQNLTAKELETLVNIILTQIDTTNFLRSIISAKGVNILSKMNPQTQGSTQIASGKQSAAQ